MNAIAVENLTNGDVFTIAEQLTGYMRDLPVDVPITVIDRSDTADRDNDYLTAIQYGTIGRTSAYLRHGTLVQLVSAARTAAALTIGDVFSVADAFNTSPLYMPTQANERLTVTEIDRIEDTQRSRVTFAFGGDQSSYRTFDNEYDVTVHPVNAFDVGYRHFGDATLELSERAAVTIGNLLEDNANGDRLVRSGDGSPYVLTRKRDYSGTNGTRMVLVSPTTGDVRLALLDSIEWTALPDNERASANETAIANTLARYHVEANEHRASSQRSQADFEVINEFMNDLANHTSWCGEYEEHMNTLNGKLSTFNFVGRETEHEVQVTLTLTISGTVTALATSVESALEDVAEWDASDIAQQLGVSDAFRNASDYSFETD